MKTLLDKLMERWAGVRMLEEEAKAEDVAEMLRINREEVRAHLRNNLGSNFSPESVESGSTHIGDVVHHHVETNTETGSSNGRKWLGKSLIAAALLGSGAGAPFLLNLLGGEVPAVVNPPGEGSKYDLKLGEPDAVPESKKEDQGR